MLGSSKEEIKVAALQSLIWIGIVTEEVENLVIAALHDSRKDVQLKQLKPAGNSAWRQQFRY